MHHTRVVRFAQVKSVIEPVWLLITMSDRSSQKLASLQLSKRVAPGVPELLAGDSTRILQCLLNVLVNAVKARC